MASIKLNDDYIQFVPGAVIDVVTSNAAKIYGGDESQLNSIIAMPHISNTPLKETMLTEEHRYKPLLRGIQDVPVKGDPVLLCTFAGINYYLGPINTMGDVNFNMDHARKKDTSFKKTSEAGVEKKPTVLEMAGLSTAFPRVQQARLQKRFNDELDNPEQKEMGLSEIPGDMLIEGRFGNSIRIGSRFLNPLITISNYRSTRAHIESSRDGGLIFLSHKGTLRQHFNADGKFNEESEEIEPTLFILADSDMEEPIRNIQQTFATGLGRGILDSEETYESEEDIYEYRENQILINSDRLTFNARKDSIFMASFQYLHFGAGNTITFSTNNNFLISAETTTVIDSPIIKLGTDNNEETEPLVLGDELVTFLEQLMGVIKKMNDNISQQVFATGAGPTAVGPTNAAAFKALNQSDITTLENNISDILSKTNRTT